MYTLIKSHLIQAYAAIFTAILIALFLFIGALFWGKLEAATANTSHEIMQEIAQDSAKRETEGIQSEIKNMQLNQVRILNRQDGIYSAILKLSTR
jgi:hypothetical protein